MNKLTVYHYPQCGTCRKAIKWLQEKGHELELIHIVDHPPGRDELDRFVRLSGLDSAKMFNTSGQMYRELGMKDRLKTMSYDERLDLLAAHGKLIKRPIVTDGEKVTVGFNEQQFESVWG